MQQMPAIANIGRNRTKSTKQDKPDKTGQKRQIGQIEQKIKIKEKLTFRRIIRHDDNTHRLPSEIPLDVSEIVSSIFIDTNDRSHDPIRPIEIISVNSHTERMRRKATRQNLKIQK